MRTGRSWPGTVVAVVAAGLALAAIARMPTSVADAAFPLAKPMLAALAFTAGAVVIWRTDPAYTLSAAIFLTPLAGNWPRLGVPGPLSPDRLLFVAAIAVVLLRAPPVADRPRLRITGTHWLLALAAAYAVVSALLAGTFFQRDGFIRIFDAFGILPFLTFLVAAVVFRTPAQRRVLLGTLVMLGAYLGLTVLFEMLKLDALVFPKYILDPNYGLHPSRGRGPFVDPVACGLALYTCAVACAIAVASWRRPGMRVVAVAVGILCVVGAFLSLQRSVWIGAVVGTAVAMLVVRRLRAYLIPVAATTAVAIAAAQALIPGLSPLVSERVNEPSALWDRKNLDRAGINMLADRPLLGFGWSRFTTYSGDYFEQADDYPLTAAGVNPNDDRFGLHNTPLLYGVELGLIGLTPWLLGLVLGVGAALATRGPPDLRPWRIGLLAVALAFLVVINAVPPSAWPNRSLWLLAGAVYAGRYATDAVRQDVVR
jgi:putative inorganic carbon (HCO3(-)) transporter